MRLPERTEAMETAAQTEKEVLEETASAGSTAKLIREIKQKTRKRFAAEEKIRIVLEGFRKEIPVSDLCRRENISSALYYSWLKDFMEAGKRELKGDSLRHATRSEVNQLQEENNRLKIILGEQALEIQLLKKSLRT